MERSENHYKENVACSSPLLPISYCADIYDSLVDHEVPFHWHEEFEFLLVTHGEIECKTIQKNCAMRQKRVKKGNGVFFNSKSLHSMKAILPHSKSEAILFTKDFLGMITSVSIQEKILTPLSQLPVPEIFLTSSSESCQNILNRIAILYKINRKTPNYELYCIENICSMFRHLLTIVSNIDSPRNTSPEVNEIRLLTMISFIHKNYNKNINAADISRSANISRSECFRCFKTVINQTPLEYLNDHRLARAASSLLETNKPVAVIADECGFNSASYFSSVFKNKFCMTPHEYRKKFEISRHYL